MDNNKKIVHMIVFISLLFLTIIGYLTYFQIAIASRVAQNPYNKRQWAREDQTIRGSIYDRNGRVLAETQVEEGRLLRQYPFGNLYSHVIGYSYKQYGRSGVESYYNEELMALNVDSPVARLRERITGDMIRGNHLVLTIDHELQRVAERLLRGKTGSIVALDPRSGEVLAMVSKPDYNPNTLVENWATLVENQEAPLLNRSLAGMYPPGSTYKVVIAAGALENAHVDSDYECTGSITIDGYTLSDFNQRGHGPIDLRNSLVVSCNTNFARMAVALGEDKVGEISKRFFLGRRLPGDMPIKQSLYPYNGNMGDTDLAAVGIGQGKLLVSPIHMAVIAGIFANDGIMVEPHIVKEVLTPEGRNLQQTSGKESTILSKEVAQQVKDMMVGVVAEGTGRNARISGVKVGGKTGTAQNPSGESHAWFIGFAPADNPTVAVAVILEREGQTGGTAAAPLGREVLQQALRGGR